MSNPEKPKIGRPRTGRIEPISVAIPPELLTRLMAFAEKKGMTRSEAIRRLLERGLPKK
jgi:metal-responsive CopG/Arc/MetJ family transcriptional regulator